MAVGGGMLRFQTPGNGHVVDLTDGVARIVATSGVDRGLACVFAIGATVGVTTMEYEPGGVSDLQRLLDRSSRRRGTTSTTVSTATPTPTPTCGPR